MLLEHPAPNFTAERAALEAAIVALQRQPAAEVRRAGGN